MFYISFLKFFVVSRFSNFRILESWISWRLEIPKHESRNKFCRVTWEVNIMEFGQFMSYYKTKIFIKTFYEKCGQEISSRPLCVYKELNTTYILSILSKTFKICQHANNQHAEFLRFIFIQAFLRIKKFLELIFRPHFL